jgi:4-aminobutyrate aminotransferase-like enzyme
MLLAVEFASPSLTRRFAAACLARGLIVNWTLHRDTVVRLAPPLTLRRAEVAHALAVMDAALVSLGSRGR